MRKPILVASLFVFSLLFQNAFAEASLKIAVVDFQKALNNVEQARKAKEALKKDFEAKQKKLDLQQDQLKKLREELDKQRLVSSEAGMRAKEESFSEKYMELQKSFVDYRNDISEREAQFTGEIIKNLREICAEIGKKEGYALIVENSQNAVLYAESQENLTNRVVDLYNKRFKTPLKLN
ncbi:MAG: OmpH family outer membrane protein [Deltaproteobacteria bacterium]|nr:OmpH family outer membrane protein [Deltaproteobacteria bacterium]MBI4374242.1 OmpH family outer membrane protein [Deltaproteobacteria bacterium]